MDPNDRTSTERRTVSPSCRLVREQLTQGSFDLFLILLTPMIRRFDPKSADFSEIKPRDITRTYLIQKHKSKLRKLEARKKKKTKNPSSRMQQGFSSSCPEI